MRKPSWPLYNREFESVLADIPADVLCNHPALVEFDNLNLMEAKSGLIVSKLKPLLLKYPPACLRLLKGLVEIPKR